MTDSAGNAMRRRLRMRAAVLGVRVIIAAAWAFPAPSSAQSTEWLEPVQSGWQTDVYLGPDAISSGARAFSGGIRRGFQRGTSIFGVRASISWIHHQEESGYPYYYTCVSYYPVQGCRSEIHRIREQTALAGAEFDAEVPLDLLRFTPFIGGGLVPMATMRDEATVCYVADGSSYPYTCATQKDTVYRQATAFGGYLNVGVGLRLQHLLVRVNVLAIATNPSPYDTAIANLMVGWRF